jgi:hypothetical protein
MRFSFSRKNSFWLFSGLAFIILLGFSFAEIRTRYSEQNREVFWSQALEKFSDISALEITHNSRSFSIVNDKERGWILPHSNNFPASLPLLRNLLADLANLRVVENKGAFESIPDNFGLSDAAQKDSPATRLTLKGKNSKKEPEIIFDLVVGLPKKMGNSARSQNSFYARKSGDDQVLLLSPLLEISNKPDDWFTREPISLRDFSPKKISAKAVAAKTAWEFNFSADKKWQVTGAESKALPADAAEQLLTFLSPLKIREAAFNSSTWSDKLPIASIVLDFSDAEKLTILLRKHEGKTLAQMQFSAALKKKKPEWVSLENVVFSLSQAPEWLWP